MRRHLAHSSTNWRERAKEPGKADNGFTRDDQPRDMVSSRYPRKPGPWTKSVRRAEPIGKPLPESNRIYVGNMLYHATPEDVMAHLTDAGFEVQNIDMSMDPFTGRNPSYCFVDLTDASQAQRAIETLNGTTLLGRVLKVKPCIIKEPNHERDQPVIDRWSRTDAEGHWKGVGDSKVRLFVAGLPKPGSQLEGEKMIHEIFAGFKINAISKVKSPPGSKTDPLGNHYFAFVDLSTPEEAKAALKAVNGKQLETGRIRVEMPRNDERGWIHERDEALWVMGEDEEDTPNGVSLS